MSGQSGNTDERVRWYQTILRHVFGFPHLAVNGNHNDPATRGALRQVQAQLGLSRKTGFLTVESNAALTQAALSRIYRSPRPTPIKGFSTELGDAVRRFQRDQRIGVDGKVGPQTRARMNKVLTGMVSTRALFGFHAALAMPPDVMPVSPWRLRPRDAHVPAPSRPGSASRTLHPVDPPFRWICELNASVASTKAAARGSGVLISPRHVLTCAHNLYGDMNDDDGVMHTEQVVRVKIIPARDNRARTQRIYTSKPFGVHSVGDHFYDERWEKLYGVASLFDDDYDFAVVELEKPISMSLAPKPLRRKTPPPGLISKFGYWGFRDVERIAALIDDSAPRDFQAGLRRIRHIVNRDLELHSAGYPAGKGIQVHARGFLEEPPTRNTALNSLRATVGREGSPEADVDIGSRLFDNTLGWQDVFAKSKGSSGSPVWAESGPRHVRTLFGINAQNPRPGIYSLVALTPKVLSQIAERFPKTFQTYVLSAPGGRGKVRGLRVRNPH